MSDYRQRSPVDPAFLSDNNNYDPISIDDDSDTDTIRMDSPEFWSGINAEKAPVQNAPHSVMLTKSTPVSTFLKYPSCEKLDCTCPVQYPASTQDQLAEENSETNEIESIPGSKQSQKSDSTGPNTTEFTTLSYEQFKGLGDSDQRKYFDIMTRASHNIAFQCYTQSVAAHLSHILPQDPGERHLILYTMSPGVGAPGEVAITETNVQQGHSQAEDQYLINVCATDLKESYI